jgi:hypothetical protein
MNAEYSAFYGYMKAKDAAGLSMYLKRLAWKKKYVTPVLDKIMKNQMLRQAYRKIRGR